jgi:hypothetical protein
MKHLSIEIEDSVCPWLVQKIKHQRIHINKLLIERWAPSLASPFKNIASSKISQNAVF